jgi:hypothetical protein
MKEFSDYDNVIGKGEVESSILSSSTRSPQVHEYKE